MYTQEIFPRWRGFNLLGMFTSETSKYYNFRSPGYFCEEDFKMMADWGFDFARLPLSYRVWSSVDNPFEINEEKLAPLDEAVYLGKKYGIHINVCMHRLPGFCVNDDENCGIGMHFYEPTAITHLGVGGRNDIVPWPNDKIYDKWGDRTVCNKAEMEKVISACVATAQCLGVGLHCSEFGSVSNLPHDIACAWLEDLLDILKKYNTGYAMWNLRGKFGIMDNGRTDIEMKDYCGHKLDEKMLKIL